MKLIITRFKTTDIGFMPACNDNNFLSDMLLSYINSLFVSDKFCVMRHVYHVYFGDNWLKYILKPMRSQHPTPSQSNVPYQVGFKYFEYFINYSIFRV